MKNARLILALGSAAALAACGRQAELTRPADYPPQPVPYGADQPQNAEELLTPDPMAVPARGAGEQRRSEERQDDPFELPPED